MNESEYIALQKLINQVDILNDRVEVLEDELSTVRRDIRDLRDNKQDKQDA